MTDGRVLEFTGVSKSFDGVAAVNGLTARVEPGYVTAFIGPNGAGKTTTLRILLGDLRPDAGTATIGGRTRSQLGGAGRQTIGWVPETPSFRQRRTGLKHLTVVARQGGIPASRVAEVLALVGLTDVADLRIASYSLGMTQRLAVAEALLGDPGVVVLDEPANGLDPEGIRWMRLLIRGLADEGRTVLISSHLLSEVQQIADRLLVLSNGSLVFAGAIEDLEDVSSRTVAVDAADRSALAALLSGKGYEVESLRSGINVRGATAAEIGAIAAGAGVALTALHQRSPSLEDVFISLISGEYAPPMTAALDPTPSSAVPVASPTPEEAAAAETDASEESPAPTADATPTDTGAHAAEPATADGDPDTAAEDVDVAAEAAAPTGTVDEAPVPASDIVDHAADGASPTGEATGSVGPATAAVGLVAGGAALAGGVAAATGLAAAHDEAHAPDDESPTQDAADRAEPATAQPEPDADADADADATAETPAEAEAPIAAEAVHADREAVSPDADDREEAEPDASHDDTAEADATDGPEADADDGPEADAAAEPDAADGSDPDPAVAGPDDERSADDAAASDQPVEDDADSADVLETADEVIPIAEGDDDLAGIDDGIALPGSDALSHLLAGGDIAVSGAGAFLTRPQEGSDDPEDLPSAQLSIDTVAIMAIPDQQGSGEQADPTADDEGSEQRTDDQDAASPAADASNTPFSGTGALTFDELLQGLERHSDDD